AERILKCRKQERAEDDRALDRAGTETVARAGNEEQEQVDRVEEPGLRVSQERLAAIGRRVPEREHATPEPARGELEPSVPLAGVGGAREQRILVREEHLPVENERQAGEEAKNLPALSERGHRRVRQRRSGTTTRPGSLRVNWPESMTSSPLTRM